jgi:hypothetical protein
MAAGLMYQRCLSPLGPRCANALGLFLSVPHVSRSEHKHIKIYVNWIRKVP